MRLSVLLGASSALIFGVGTVAAQSPLPGSAPPQPGAPSQPYPPAPQPQPYPQPPAAPTGPSAGGLTALQPIDPNAQGGGNGTEQKLAESKEDDSGRGLSFFYIDVEGGYQYVSLETFDAEEAALTAGFIDSEGHGGFIGAGLGLRLLSFTLGPRLRWGAFPDYQVLSVGGEFGFRIQLGILEPHLMLGVGYTALGNLSNAVHPLPESISIDGVDARLGFGFDVFVIPVLSLGIGAAWELLGLKRPAIALADFTPEAQAALTEQQKQVFQKEGSSYGSAVTINGKVGLHF